MIKTLSSHFPEHLCDWFVSKASDKLRMNQMYAFNVFSIFTKRFHTFQDYLDIIILTNSTRKKKKYFIMTINWNFFLRLHAMLSLHKRKAAIILQTIHTFIVDLTITINIGLSDHLINLFICKLFS